MRHRLIGIVTTVVTVVAASTTLAGPLVGTNLREFDLVFDSYCDGLHVVVNYRTGLVSGNLTGDCETGDAIYGTVGSLIGKKRPGLALIVRDDKFDSIKIIRDDGTWAYYDSAGSVVNSGTYSLGVALGAEASRPRSNTRSK